MLFRLAPHHLACLQLRRNQADEFGPEVLLFGPL
jgi:hypothetical protein